MIARLEGTLLQRTPTRVLIDIGGVGYEALIPLSTFAALPDEGKTVALRIHTHVREEAFTLFGFATDREKDAFELLLHASRVGPKLAQTVLSGLEADALLRAIRTGDVVTLKSVPGVGAKLAERLIVELRDRAETLLEAAVGGAPSVAGPSGGSDGVRGELVSALVNLQTQKAKAERVADAVLADADADAAIETLVREALRRLGG